MAWLMHVPEGCPSELGWVSSLLGVYRIHDHATPFMNGNTTQYKTH